MIGARKKQRRTSPQGFKTLQQLLKEPEQMELKEQQELLEQFQVIQTQVLNKRY
jgi:hypothetical protein